VDDQLEAFLKQCVESPLTNQQTKKALEKYPLPAIAELRPPNDMTLKLLVSKPVTAHDGWLQKLHSM